MVFSEFVKKSNMKSYLSSVLRNFILLFIIFFPVGFLGSIQFSITNFVFGRFITFLAHSIFQKPIARIDFSSDSLSMFLLFGCLFLTSIVFSFIKSFRIKTKYIENLFSFYLALILLKYGFDKVFKAQFYLPEPNILFTRFGNLDRDILFWSTMGTSYLYSLILGLIEVGIAILLLIPRTKIIGAMLSCFVFLQIITINFSFDISVKLFSSLLFLISLYVSRHFWIKIWKVLKSDNVSYTSNIWLQRLGLSLKTFFVCFVVWNCISPFLAQNQFNDDLIERPFLHGAYKTISDSTEIEYVFFHRNEYTIFMNKNEKQTDFKYFITENQIVFENLKHDKIYLNYQYSEKDSLLILRNQNLNLKLKAIDWRKSKALQPLFHLMIEDVE